MTELETANQRIAALETELAAMRATGAPVAWGVFATIGGRILSSAPTTQELAESIAKNTKTPAEVRPLYTHPQPAAQDAGRKPLTAGDVLTVRHELDMRITDDRGQGLHKPHGARPVTNDGRLLWVGPVLPHERPEFFLDGVYLGCITLEQAMEAYSQSAPDETTKGHKYE